MKVEQVLPIPTQQTQRLHRYQVMEFLDITLSVLSWQQRDVLERTLASFRSRGIDDLFPNRRIFFNTITGEDRNLAQAYRFEAIGDAANIGIFGGFKGLVDACTTEFLLFVENDCPAIVAQNDFRDVTTRAIADMREHNCPVFSMRSRRQPGEAFDRRLRYEKYFRIEQPLATTPDETSSKRQPTATHMRIYENLRRPSLRGCALFAEEHPDLRHPALITQTNHGNWLTTSQVLNWSNNCLLAKTDFLRDTVIPHVEAHPAPSTINGHQDIEAALKQDRWWQRQRIPMGQAEPGPLTHQRGKPSR